MYVPTYGYAGGPGNNSSAPAPQAPGPFIPQIPNGVTQQQHQQQSQPHQAPHHIQQNQQQQHQQHPGQQPHHMMYNPQAQAQAQAHAQAQQYAGHSPYGGVSGPGMGGNAAAMGMMPNNGMAQMPGSHVPTYQTPYSSSPYGGNIPTSSPANMPPNFMPTASNAPSFSMNAPSMNPQHQAQRMQQPLPSSTPTPQGQRASAFPGIQHNTPPNAGQAQSQFSTPQSTSQTHLQTPNHNPQSQGQPVITPQTPNFPPGPGGPIATPLSPGSESREKERVTLLLDINNGLLREVMRIQSFQAEVKEAAAASPEADKGKAEKEKAEKLKAPSKDYVECMRRLQSNLAYLAAIADRSHKPSSQIPPHPAIMTAPPLAPRSTNTTTSSSSSPKSETKKEEGTEDTKSLEGDPEDQSKLLKDLYERLAALFPGVDINKETPFPGANQVARAQAAQQAAAQIQAQKQGQSQQQSGQLGQGGQGQDHPNAQQKLQNDLLRQKMMQQAQNQQMAQGMQGMGNPQQMGNN